MLLLFIVHCYSFVLCIVIVHCNNCSLLFLIVVCCYCNVLCIVKIQCDHSSSSLWFFYIVIPAIVIVRGYLDHFALSLCMILFIHCIECMNLFMHCTGCLAARAGCRAVGGWCRAACTGSQAARGKDLNVLPRRKHLKTIYWFQNLNTALLPILIYLTTL